jgi:RNA polymerase primary sigma factor
LAPGGPLETYLREINSTPLLSAEEERQLACRVRDGDLDARDHLIRANLRLVVNIAKRYTGRGLPLEDLVGEGNLGLVRAVGRFDPAMNTRFSTYVGHWVKQSIRLALANTAMTIRIPVYLVELVAKWRRTTAQVRQELKRPAAEEEVALRMGLSKKKLAVIKKALCIRNALTRRWPEEEVVQGGRAEAPDAAPAEADERRQVVALLDHLGAVRPREAVVLRMQFGLDGGGPKTLREIGRRLGLSRELVRQTGLTALARLRKRRLHLDRDPAGSPAPEHGRWGREERGSAQSSCAPAT